MPSIIVKQAVISKHQPKTAQTPDTKVSVLEAAVGRVSEVVLHVRDGAAKMKSGLYANIHAKRKRISAGSGERMRKPGSAGAPTAKAFRQSALTAKPKTKGKKQ